MLARTGGRIIFAAGLKLVADSKLDQTLEFNTSDYSN